MFWNCVFLTVEKLNLYKVKLRWNFAPSHADHATSLTTKINVVIMLSIHDVSK